MKRRTLLPLCAAFALTSCLPNAADPAKAAGLQAAALRGKYAASALEAFALGYGATQVQPFQVMRSHDGRMSSMLCPLLDGSRAAVVITWPAAMGPGVRPADVSNRLRHDLRGNVRAGRVTFREIDLSQSPDCTVPPLPDDWPVVVLPASLPGSEPVETFREEIQAATCPKGYAGAIVQRRLVKFSTEAPPVGGAWEDVKGKDDCRPQTVATVEVERPALAPWDTHRKVALNGVLMANSPENCTRATVTGHTTGEEPETLTISTCHQVGFAEPPAPVCPGEIMLPPMSSKLEYSAAVMPYEAELKNLPADCEVTITSDAHWPIWVTFNIEAANQTRLTRLYHARLPMRWTGRGGDDSFAFSAWSWSNLYAVPDWLMTDPQHWLMLRWTGPSSGAVYTMNGRGYWDFIGPNTAPASGKLAGYNPGHFPVPYANPGANPWGNTAEQAARSHGFSYAAFSSRHYNSEGVFQ